MAACEYGSVAKKTGKLLGYILLTRRCWAGWEFDDSGQAQEELHGKEGVQELKSKRPEPYDTLVYKLRYEQMIYDEGARLFDAQTQAGGVHKR